ncbi:MAG: dockerin type I repeat-containing protein [Prevotella sp.]|nr:dockerin type I repeat-containing protein [Prevotella sp.]
MKKTYRLFLTIALLTLSSLSIMAQLNGSGYYRVKNAGTGNYISLENNKFDYQTIIATAGNGAKHMFSYSMFLVGTIADDYGVPAALSCAGAYLKTDIHMVNDSECELPSTVIYLKQNSGDNYDIQAQSTGLVQLTTGSYKTSNITCTFNDLYATVKKVNGTGANTTYYVSEKLTGTGTLSSYGISKTITIGTEYFLDEGDSFGMTESYSSSNNKHKWYIEPVTAINVTPSTSFGGKHYTTYYTAFPYTIGGNILNVYAVSNINEDGTMEIKAIEGTVPACTPVLLECSSMTGNHIVPTGTPTIVASDATPTSSYTGTNLLKGTFFSNTDGNMYFDNYTGTTVGTQGTTVTNGKFFNANNYTAATNPQKYVLGITESGKLGFVKATGTAMPANKAWLEYTGTAELVLPFEEPTKPGDVNRDGDVDVNDITAMVNIILGKDDPTYDYEAAELDGNDGITVGDLTVLVNIILNN